MKINTYISALKTKKRFKAICSMFPAVVLFLAMTATAVCAAEKEPNVADFTLPKPAAPNYMMFEAADRSEEEGNDMLTVVSVADQSVLEFSAEYYADSEAFYEKYGLYHFALVMQFDSSLDGTDSWNHTEAWDREYSAPGSHNAANIAWMDGEMFDTITLFDLYYEGYEDLAPAIISKQHKRGDYEWETRYFDAENHDLYIRCRYFMEWETYDGENIGERQCKYSEWSEPAIFGKNSTAVIPEEPSGYEAPIISDFVLIPPGKAGELGSLTYIQSTPEQVWQAEIYYVLTGNGYMDSLETEICVEDGDWQAADTGNSFWPLLNGKRWVYSEGLMESIKEDTDVKLRIRFNGSHGTSEWSNVLVLNGGDGGQTGNAAGNNQPGNTAGTDNQQSSGNNKPGTSSNQPDKEQNTGSLAGLLGTCSFCGFCPTLLGLCIFIWAAILLVLLIILFVVIYVIMKKRKR